jgi:20S proteasome subunit beta 2
MFNYYTGYRNSFLAGKGFASPKTTKTGTTICGAIFEGGVVVGADTRSTSGDIVADKNCMKIHDLAPNMVCNKFNKNLTP